MDSTSLLDAVGAWFHRRALLFKIAGVSLLGLLLLIPLAMVQSTLTERHARYREAVGSIAQTWGGPQRLLGPVLVVPYTWRVEYEEAVTIEGRRVLEKKTREMKAEAFFLPERLEVEGAIDPSSRQRGIYTAHVYAAKAAIRGHFARPDFSFVGLRGLEPQWERARVEVGVSDLRGAREALLLQWGGVRVPLQPGVSLDRVKTGVHAPVPLNAGEAGVDFALDLQVNGSGGLSMVPMGRETRLRLVSSWSDPSFSGAYLPTQRSVTAQGFEATWQVSFYGRNFPQQWSSVHTEVRPGEGDFAAAAFGVELIEGVSAYRVIERAIKYGVLFLALVFTTFFLFEAASGLRLNALNYLLVGAALCLFYLGLLALAEFWPFGAAYGTAAAASLALVGGYSAAILRSGRRALGVSGLLGLVYGYLYFVLQMEDYALLAGTAALFVALAAVMWVTRRLDWQGRDSESGGTESRSATPEAVR
jgi:inner membrane protein